MRLSYAIIGEILGFLGAVFSVWWFWLIVAILLLFWGWQYRRRASYVSNQDVVLLHLEIPRENDKQELAAEQMLASLHGILRSNKELRREGILQEHVSFEMAAIGQRVRFYIWTPRTLQNFIEGQIYAQYPTVQIEELEEDYSKRPELSDSQHYVTSTEIVLTDSDVLPIKTFPSFEVDPLAGITATLAKLDKVGEEMWLQVLAMPIDNSWQKRSQKMIKRIKSGGTVFAGSGFFGWMAQLFGSLSKVPESSDGGATAATVSERDKSRISAIEEKSNKLGYKVRIRIVYVGKDKTTARLQMQAIVGTFKQFNSTNLNGFKSSGKKEGGDALSEYQARFMLNKGYTLNIEEVASIFHLPHTTVETPNIDWARSKTAEPPGNLPEAGSIPDTDVSLFGITNFRGSNAQFGILRRDRGRHLYIIGQTGVGKSGLLQLLTLSEVFYNEGFAVIDPHGDYATDVMSFIPAHRVQDVVYFNPADTAFPIAFNPMEVTDPSMKNHISSELVGVLKRMFESWGPRLEYILRYTILALLDYPNATMLDITRMLTEKDFRDSVIDHVDDPVVRSFWTVEFASWNDKFASEAVAPVLNKVGAFTANPMIRNIVGQPKSSFNIRQIMDEGKILIVNLSRGLVGEDNAAILGSLIVTKIQLAAMSRADIVNIDDRLPFYLYVDEFQNFATDSFATILSEARKYGLRLTVANQYIAQMNEVVRDAVFGNVGSLISFRVGADDAAVLQKYFEPQFESGDLIQLPNRSFVAGMSIAGEKSLPFSAKTLNIPTQEQDYTPHIIENSRALYTRTKPEVEKLIYYATTSFKDNMDAAQPQNGYARKQKSANNDKGGDRKPRSKKKGVSPTSQTKKNDDVDVQKDKGHLQTGNTINLN